MTKEKLENANNQISKEVLDSSKEIAQQIKKAQEDDQKYEDMMKKFFKSEAIAKKVEEEVEKLGTLNFKSIFDIVSKFKKKDKEFSEQGLTEEQIKEKLKNYDIKKEVESSKGRFDLFSKPHAEYENRNSVDDANQKNQENSFDFESTERNFFENIGDGINKLARNIVGEGGKSFRGNQFADKVRRGIKDGSVRDIKSLFSCLESQGSGGYSAENGLGYMGAYQFGASALVAVGLVKDLNGSSRGTGYSNNRSEYEWTDFAKSRFGVDSRSDYLNNHAAQDYAVYKLMENNWKQIESRGFDKLVGKEVQGELITKEGLLLTMHLLGMQGLSDGLSGKVTQYTQDKTGTSWRDYMEAGAVYAVSRAYVNEHSGKEQQVALNKGQSPAH